LAHDLRNPITDAAKLATETLAHGPRRPTRATARRLDNILRALGRANHLIQDLLDVARIEAGQLSSGASGWRREQPVLDAVEAQKPVAASASLAAGAELTPACPEILGRSRSAAAGVRQLDWQCCEVHAAGWAHHRDGGDARQRDRLWRDDRGRASRRETSRNVFDRFWQARKARPAAGLAGDRWE